MRKGLFAMFDEILDLFDRNGRGNRNGSRPGLLGRMFGGASDGDASRHRRTDDDHLDIDDDDDREDRGRSRRRRDDDFGFDD